MSLQDESFPSDDLYDMLNSNSANNNHKFQCQFSMCLYQDDDNLDRNTSPFLNSDCSEKTCASDPLGVEHEPDDIKQDSLKNMQKGHHSQLGSGRSNKAVSYQDIHSAYTNQIYNHVSKVKKYITDIHDQEKQQRTASSAFHRHRSMPENLTPRSSAEEQQKLNTSLSPCSSSATDTHDRDESYERLNNERERLQSYNGYLKEQLYKITNHHILLKRNFEVLRTELSDCKDKLKRPSNGSTTNNSLNYALYITEKVTKATQTDLPNNTSHILHLSDLSDLPVITTDLIPHANTTLNDLTYNSSASSIGIPLPTVPPAIRQQIHKKPIKTSSSIKPLSLNFSNDNEVDSNDNKLVESDAGKHLKPSSSNRIVTNNSGSSQPSSNDSAIEIEGHELRSPRPRYCHPTVNFVPFKSWEHTEGVLYFDKQSNQIIKLVTLNQSAVTNPNNNNSIHSQSLNVLQYTANAPILRRKKSLASRLFRVFRSCDRCNDPNRSLDTTNATYTVGIPLLGNDSNCTHNMR